MAFVAAGYPADWFWPRTSQRRKAAATVSRYLRPPPHSKKMSARRGRLPSNTAVVLSVRADPIPDDDGTIENTQSAVAESDANGIDVFRLFYFLEAKARVPRISAEKPLGLTRLGLNFIWQGSKCGSEGARGARLNH